ncbi:PAAR domain-containing protein [Stutzerimonas kunmingensis]|uniref:PAAR domain-containing protein n=1 Tax=Stutzerimonas kunmingensis TaxID=1211807 RepID=UPI0028B03480|nr:PAAR domain-containing protein [Stutzerimonas kunmingensis]
MPAVHRLADVCTGHGPHPPRPNIQGSPDVLVNGRGVHRVGDGWAGHDHGGVMATGSSSVRVNGMAMARVGDRVSCGSLAATGSPNVFAGG